MDFEREFGRIIDDFVDAYRRGLTPNPCIRCNAWLKFGHLLTLARRLGARRIATGHYARIVAGQAGRWAVARARDASKDQSYVLHPLTQEALAHTELPLGDLTKVQVRAVASRQGLSVADKPESQEICFTAGADYRELLRQRAPEAFEPGDLVDTGGQVLGTHAGIGGLTVGQRRGLGLAVGRPLHVLKIDAGTRRVVVGDRSQLGVAGLEAVEFSWMGMDPPDPDAEPLACRAQVRYHHEAQPARVRLLSDGRVSLRFDAPVAAVAPGQSVVLYDARDVVLGGGIIATTLAVADQVACS
jgi:tRNA-specific 2-thiouridylase